MNEIGAVDDRRLFAGEYVQVDWKPDDRWDALAGIRLNEAYEHKSSSDLTLPPPLLDAETVSKTMIRAVRDDWCKLPAFGNPAKIRPSSTPIFAMRSNRRPWISVLITRPIS